MGLWRIGAWAHWLWLRVRVALAHRGMGGIGARKPPNPNPNPRASCRAASERSCREVSASRPILSPSMRSSGSAASAAAGAANCVAAW